MVCRSIRFLTDRHRLGTLKCMLLFASMSTSDGAVEGVDGCPASMLKSQRGMRFNNVDNTTSNGAYPSDDDDPEEERMIREYARRLENGAEGG